MGDADDLGGFQLLELRSTLPDELLMYGDKLSMAHGLEARVPFLDREIVEWVERLDANFKIRHFARKWLHKRACAALLPASILRRRKRGFGVNVVDAWLRDSKKTSMHDLLLDPRSLMYEFLRPETVAVLLREHVARHHDHHKVLFSLVVLEQWLRNRSSEASSLIQQVAVTKRTAASVH
jgi:asparagine synthase (glutamine-hydrolysing)